MMDTMRLATEIEHIITERNCSPDIRNILSIQPVSEVDNILLNVLDRLTYNLAIKANCRCNVKPNKKKAVYQEYIPQYLQHRNFVREASRMSSVDIMSTDFPGIPREHKLQFVLLNKCVDLGVNENLLKGTFGAKLMFHMIRSPETTFDEAFKLLLSHLRISPNYVYMKYTDKELEVISLIGTNDIFVTLQGRGLIRLPPSSRLEFIRKLATSRQLMEFKSIVKLCTPLPYPSAISLYSDEKVSSDNASGRVKDMVARFSQRARMMPRSYREFMYIFHECTVANEMTKALEFLRDNFDMIHGLMTHHIMAADALAKPMRRGGKASLDFILKVGWFTHNYRADRTEAPIQKNGFLLDISFRYIMVPGDKYHCKKMRECSICLSDEYEEYAEFAKCRQCSSPFHSACIGAAFNAMCQMNAVKCPNCRMQVNYVGLLTKANIPSRKPLITEKVIRAQLDTLRRSQQLY
jgi:hypothetical protein